LRAELLEGLGVPTHRSQPAAAHMPL
jgi:hypothetical protein